MFKPQQPETVTLLNGTEAIKVGTITKGKMVEEVFQKGTRFYYFSRRQFRLFPISKKELGL